MSEKSENETASIPGEELRVLNVGDVAAVNVSRIEDGRSSSIGTDAALLDLREALANAKLEMETMRAKHHLKIASMRRAYLTLMDNLDLQKVEYDDLFRSEREIRSKYETLRASVDEKRKQASEIIEKEERFKQKYEKAVSEIEQVNGTLGLTRKDLANEISRNRVLEETLRKEKKSCEHLVVSEELLRQHVDQLERERAGNMTRLYNANDHVVRLQARVDSLEDRVESLLRQIEVKVETSQEAVDSVKSVVELSSATADRRANVDYSEAPHVPTVIDTAAVVDAVEDTKSTDRSTRKTDRVEPPPEDAKIGRGDGDSRGAERCESRPKEIAAELKRKTRPRFPHERGFWVADGLGM
eukprot:g1120.t1